MHHDLYTIFVITHMWTLLIDYALTGTGGGIYYKRWRASKRIPRPPDEMEYS